MISVGVAQNKFGIPAAVILEMYGGSHFRARFKFVVEEKANPHFFTPNFDALPL